MGSKLGHVRSLFEKPNWYLKRIHNIRIRIETVKEFLKNESFSRILDIGCGDGSISLPLLTPQRHLTLTDLSEGMLSIAHSKIPAELVENVEIVNKDFMAAAFGEQSYDLIVCVGVLAHVDSPEALLRKIVSLLEPGGSLVLEQTAADHFMTDIVRLLEKAHGLFVPEKYERNQLSRSEIIGMLEKQGLELVASFRYSLPLPGMHRLFNQNSLYKMIRLVYGAYPHARLSRLGNECIYLFKLTDRPGQGGKRPEKRFAYEDQQATSNSV